MIFSRSAEPRLDLTSVRLGSFRPVGIRRIDPRVFYLQSVDLAHSPSRDTISLLILSLSRSPAPTPTPRAEGCTQGLVLTRRVLTH